MKIIEPGHVYELSSLDGDLKQLLTFVAREPDEGRVHPGTQTQDVLRCLIDRTQHCDKCLRWEGNDLIIKYLQMALVLHEARALLRKTEKGYIKPEKIVTGDDGHFLLKQEAKCGHCMDGGETKWVVKYQNRYMDESGQKFGTCPQCFRTFKVGL